MMDIILEEMVRMPEIGLVFAGSTNFCTWDGNFELGRALAERMKLNVDVSRPFFDYPAGMMFWCRPCALLPLIRTSIDWEEYPPEPLSDDGTICHAIERILPFVCQAQGYSCATTWPRAE